MGKIRVGGYIFVTWIGDHEPRHVHVFKDGQLIVKWDLAGRGGRGSEPQDPAADQAIAARGTTMKGYKVKSVTFSNHKHAFALRIVGRPGKDYVVPYSYANVKGAVGSAEPDAEIGKHGFLWATRDGDVGTMLVEQVLHMHRDPEVIRTHLLHDLSIRAEKLRQERRISAAVLAEMAGTTPARVSHLLKPNTYRNKSLWAMLRLLIVLGDDIERKLIDAA